MKRRLRAAVVPILLLGITGYFVYNAINGGRGIRAQRHEQAVLVQDQATLKSVSAGHQRWQARVDALRHNSIDRDMLDQQVRSVLNLANPDDLALPLKPPPANATPAPAASSAGQ